MLFLERRRGIDEGSLTSLELMNDSAPLRFPSFIIHSAASVIA